MIGIYKIMNIVDNKIYIGQSWNIRKRFTEHKRLLNKEQHPNRYLQFAWNKYGSESFEFSVVCDLSFVDTLDNQKAQKLLDDAEIAWLDYFGGENSNNIYNFKSGGSRGKYSDEYKQKLSEDRKGKFTGKDNPMYGRHHSEETKKRISKNRKGTSSWNKGKHHSEETRRKISIANSNRVITEEERAKKREVMNRLLSDPNFVKKAEQARKKPKLKQRKYSDDFVIMIRNEYANNKISITKLANKYNMPRSLCQNILEHKGRFADIP